MRRIIPLKLFCCILIISGCNNETSKTKISLRQEWFPNSNYAGALFAKYDYAKQHNIELEIEPGSDQIDPIQMVIQGHNTFGDASADKVLQANEKGADLVVIGVVNYQSPTCFLTKKEKNITTPKDFEGKVVGVLTGTNTEYIYRTLIKKTGINQKLVKEVEAPFDLNSFISADAYDVRPAFIYDEPVSLDLHHIEYEIIEPRNYGVHFLGTVYFTKRETILKQPDLVQSFVNSIADGWSAAIKYPERAIELLKKYDPNIDSNRELLSLKKGLDYFRGKNNKILWCDRSDWEKMISFLKDLKVVKDVNIDKFLDNSFLLDYYSTHKKKHIDDL